MKIKELDSKLPKEMLRYLMERRSLYKKITQSSGIPKKYINEDNTNEKKI